MHMGACVRARGQGIIQGIPRRRQPQHRHTTCRTLRLHMPSKLPSFKNLFTRRKRGAPASPAAARLTPVASQEPLLSCEQRQHHRHEGHDAVAGAQGAGAARGHHRRRTVAAGMARLFGCCGGSRPRRERRPKREHRRRRHRRHHDAAGQGPGRTSLTRPETVPATPLASTSVVSGERWRVTRRGISCAPVAPAAAAVARIAAQ
jgi:hypothetical protein